ncbi:cobalamin/Fe(3+)-siderophore ABC transporter ATP-binding protein, partial [Priestia megaterium]
ALQDKKIYAQGRPEEVINCDLVQRVFNMNCEVTVDPLFGTPLCIPHGRGRCIVNKLRVETQHAQ